MKKIGLIIAMVSFTIASFAQYSGGLEKYSCPSNQMFKEMPQANANAAAFTPLLLVVVAVIGIVSGGGGCGSGCGHGHASTESNSNYHKNLQLSQLD